MRRCSRHFVEVVEGESWPGSRCEGGVICSKEVSLMFLVEIAKVGDVRVDVRVQALNNHCARGGVFVCPVNEHSK